MRFGSVAAAFVAVWWEEEKVATMYNNLEFEIYKQWQETKSERVRYETTLIFVAYIMYILFSRYSKFILPWARSKQIGYLKEGTTKNLRIEFKTWKQTWN